ncbi:MAG: T9SS type A sorting domain-containing protein, partial [Flavipsychrobacter sp.]|nr:T9SS type A sorting domain-containing protein [Flavipsychrobacter sp.]
GGLDSVKRIQLLAYDNGVLQTADSFHQAEIVLSKQQGICAAMEFYMFPFHAPGDTVIYDDYYLVTSMQPLLYPTHWPITDPKPGPYAATFRRVHFDNVDSAAFNVMNVGDVYQYTVCVQSPANIITTCIEPGYRQDSIVSKTMVSGGIQYVVQGWSAYKQYMFGQPYYHVTPRVDTFVLSATAPHLGIYLPETPKPLWYYDGDIMYYYPDDTTFCLQGEKYVAYSYWFAGCTYSEHKPGLGQVKFAFFDGTNPSVNGANIFYYNRNGISCGIPLVPDTTQPVSVSNATERQLNIYPNPAANELAIESVAGYSVQLVNMMGQVVYAKDLCGEKERINVSQLADGVYLVKVQRDKEPVLSRKVLVQH